MAVYLDNAATTKPSAEVISAITHCLSEVYGNPSSLHRMGLDAELLMEDARKQIASAIGTQSECIVFTSGATESSNLAIRSACSVYGKRKKHIVVSAVEHASVRSTVDEMEKQGFEVTRVFPNADGEFDAKDFIDAVTDSTCLVTMMLVENETGRVLPVKKVFSAVKKRFPEIITHCDAVQAFMKIPVKVNELKADLMSVSAHKIHGPKGTGALFIRKGIRVQPIVTGGKQEHSIRPGTEAMPLISGFGAAVALMQLTISQRYEYVKHLQEFLLNQIAGNDAIILNSSVCGSPYITNLSVKGIRSETMLHFLESKEIYVSSGSACSKGAKSGVLSAYGISDDAADSAIRVSFSENTTESEIRAFVEAVVQGQKQLIHKGNR